MTASCNPRPAAGTAGTNESTSASSGCGPVAAHSGASGGDGEGAQARPPERDDPVPDGGSVRRPAVRRRGSGRPIRVAILHNVDFDVDEGDLPSAPGNAARAEIASVARDVAAMLDDGAHVVTIVPVDGDLWRLRERLIDVDVAFNLCESLCGDARLESAVPIVLDGLQCAYTGSPPSALSAALYKDRVKAILRRAGVPTPAAQVVRSSAELGPVTFPAIVKPTREDGSIGITSMSVVYDEATCRARVDEVAATFRQPVLVEQYIEGREFNVSLFGYPTARILPLSEIDFSSLPDHLPRIVSYEAKWASGSPEDLGTVPVTFPPLPPSVAARIRRVALDAFRALGARDYGRVDLRLSASGMPYVIDVNPNCDLGRNAGLARAAAAIGMEYPDLMRLLVRYALARRKGSDDKAIETRLRDRRVARVGE